MRARSNRRKRIRWWDRIAEAATQMVADLIDPRGAAIHRRRSAGSRKAWQTRRTRQCIVKDCRAVRAAPRVGDPLGQLCPEHTDYRGAQHDERTGYVARPSTNVRD